jgi:hypothetical protein
MQLPQSVHFVISIVTSAGWSVLLVGMAIKYLFNHYEATIVFLNHKDNETARNKRRGIKKPLIPKAKKLSG